MNKITTTLTLLLITFLNSTPVHAYNLIYVNATDSPMHLTAYFGQDYDGSLLCPIHISDNIQHDIEPGGVFSHAITGCWLSHLTIDIDGQRVERHIYDPRHDFYTDNFVHIKHGTFVIRPTANGEYEISGPYQERGGAVGTLFLVNATGFGMQYYADYHSLLCAHDQGSLLPGQVVQLNISACLTDEIYGYNIAVGMGQSNKSTNKYTGSTGNGTFVFRKKIGTDNEFEVVGPLRQ